MTSSSLAHRSARARSWLMEAAFPLWLDRGLDQSNGGYHERLQKDGTPDVQPKRLRVQARQIYSCAQAGRLGWSGPWREGLQSALALMLDGQRDDGFFIHQFDAQSRRSDERADLYDQAFVLFALAHASEALNRPSLMDDAETLWRLIEKAWSRPSGGFQEGEVETLGRRRQNPHMHLFEASMACSAASARADLGTRLRDRADALGDLFLTRFYDAQNLVVREYFTEDWAPAPGDDGKIWEPGHSFEWVWLLQHWARTGGPDSQRIAQRLHAHALRNGLSANGAVAIDECWIGGGVKSAGARLWPQTERLKAALALYEMEPSPSLEAEAAAAFDGLWLYISDDGFWADRMNPDGSLVAESAPASSFYHILVALLELFRIAEPGRQTA